MAMFTALSWIKFLKLTPERAQTLGLTADDLAPPKIPPVVTQRVVEKIDELKRSGGRDWHDYGEACGDAEALRLFMRDQYRARLITKGHTKEEADLHVEAYAETSEFKQHLRSHKISLSRARQRNRFR
jgi:hypothetical protein